MKKFKKYGLILTSVLLGLYACQRGIEEMSNDDSSFKEYRSWLKHSEGIFKNEELVLQNQSGEKISGKLSWSLASEFKNNTGESILVIQVRILYRYSILINWQETLRQMIIQPII